MRKHLSLTKAGLGLALSAVAALTIGGCPPPPTGGGDGGGDGGETGNSGITGQFIGSTSCLQCHSRIHNDWEETLHADALASLEAIGQAENENCIGCHTVGYGEEGGFVNRATTNDLADVGCESCHGPGREHVMNVGDESARPPVSLMSETCGECHTGSHHPHIEEWEESGHSEMVIGDRFADGGFYLNACGECHSGEFYYRAILNTETLGNDALEGQPVEEMVAIECAICHDPHMQTGNAPEVEDGRDFQLRFPEVANPVATNTVDAATNASRFNLCGQCHHSRGRDWTATSRGPHASVQSNVFVGEMPMPDDEDTPLVFSRNSVHSFATEQCATCHLYRQDFQTELAPAIAGHTFEVNNDSCDDGNCHPSKEIAESLKATLDAEVSGRLAGIRTRLGAESTWEYEAYDGPEDQSTISDNVKKIRFLLHYIESDGSLGIHNPDYVRSMLEKAEELLDDENL